METPRIFIFQKQYYILTFLANRECTGWCIWWWTFEICIVVWAGSTTVTLDRFKCIRIFDRSMFSYLFLIDHHIFISVRHKSNNFLPVKMQHTPNPLAQLPDMVPPVKNICIFMKIIFKTKLIITIIIFIANSSTFTLSEADSIFIS